MSGAHITKESRERLSKSRTGKGNPMYGKKRPGALAGNWKGGITEEKHGVWKCHKWIKVRREIIIRDEYTCQKCGKKWIHKVYQSNEIHVHHKKPYAKHKELRYDKDNLITLCHPCHRLEHRNV